MIFSDDMNVVSVTRFIICLFFAIFVFYMEVTKKFQLSYSKFNEKGGWDPRKAMFFIYFVPLLTYLYFYATNSFSSSLYHKIILFAVVFHFGKRCAEVLFVHRFSGKISKITTLLITWAYTSIAYSIHEVVNMQTRVEMLDSSVNLTLVIGFIFFLLGQGLNFYHHKILANLRTEDRTYKIPNGGLFTWINCPHYLTEIIAWFGIAIMSKYFIVFGLSFIMSGYLVARSINTTKWYLEKIPNYPADRKSIIPFLL